MFGTGKWFFSRPEPRKQVLRWPPPKLPNKRTPATHDEFERHLKAAMLTKNAVEAKEKERKTSSALNESMFTLRRATGVLKKAGLKIKEDPSNINKKALENADATIKEIELLIKEQKEAYSAARNEATAAALLNDSHTAQTHAYVAGLAAEHNAEAIAKGDDDPGYYTIIRKNGTEMEGGDKNKNRVYLGTRRTRRTRRN